MSKVPVRKGQAPGHLDRSEFARRFRERFANPRYDRERDAIERLEALAWQAYEAGEKSPHTHPAGPGFADPAYELSDVWRAARDRVRDAAARHASPDGPTRVLLVCGASRNDGTCPGEMSKSFRMLGWAREALEDEGVEVDLLDLSLLSSEHGRRIHPCKGCVSTAMPLCHWPCSCYPNSALDQTNDWMNEIYERFTLAHGVLFVTPVYWYGLPSGLKAMVDRLVCADGGNDDPTSTSGKDPEKAKRLELAGWGYPKHLAGRAYGVVVHGDVAGAEAVRRALCDWLEWTGFVASGTQARLDRYVGYYEPYATSHDALDEDRALAEEVRNAARAVGRTAEALREGRVFRGDQGLAPPRPK